MTDEFFTAWLQDQSVVRCIIVEAGCRSGGAEITRYLATVGYVTSTSDAPANTAYLPIVKGGLQFTESLDIESSAALSFGDLELANFNGEYDAWLGDVWVNRAIQVFIGDVRWPRADFRIIFDGIVADIDSRDRNTLNISIRDKLQRLNTPISETKLGGSSINKEALIPLTFGECFNVSPLLVDEATHTYQLHVGAIEDPFEVRDNGVVVSITKISAAGRFSLNQSPEGNITTSVQGDKSPTYANTVATLIERLATGFGKASERFTAADIDSANFAAFEAANPQPVGLYVSGRINVLTAIHQLADSVGAQPVMSRQGTLRLLKIELPAPGDVTALTAYDMVANSLAIDNRVAVQSAVKIGYCRNWTVQVDLQTGIPAEHKAFFSEEWISRTANDATVAGIYKLDNEPVQKDTLLLTEADAAAEAARLLNLRKVPRTLYSFTGYAHLVNLQLGDAVTLTHNRFGLSGGASGMVVKLQIDWLTLRVKVGVLV